MARGLKQFNHTELEAKTTTLEKEGTATSGPIAPGEMDRTATTNKAVVISESRRIRTQAERAEAKRAEIRKVYRKLTNTGKAPKTAKDIDEIDLGDITTEAGMASPEETSELYKKIAKVGPAPKSRAGEGLSDEGLLAEPPQMLKKEKIVPRKVVPEHHAEEVKAEEHPSILGKITTRIYRITKRMWELFGPTPR